MPSEKLSLKERYCLRLTRPASLKCPQSGGTTKLTSNVSDQHMAADFTSYTIKALNKVPTVLSRSEKDLLLFRNVTELLTGRTALLRISKVGF